MTRTYKKQQKSSLSDHKRHGKKLIPPLLQIPNLKLSSWTNLRLPDMLWAALIISNIDRDSALFHFRNVVDYLTNFPETDQPQDVTFTAVSKIRPDVLDGLLENLCTDDDVCFSLSPITLFPDLPGRDSWCKNIPNIELSKRWELLQIAVTKCYDHQSQESTDCRWLRVLFQCVRGRMHFTPQTQHLIDEYMEYPHFGDMRAVRPSIRAAEGAISDLQKDSHEQDNDWIEHFWKICLLNTHCKKMEFAMAQKKVTTHITTAQLDVVISRLIEHCNQNRLNTDIDAKFDATFGISLYSLQILKEIVNNKMNQSILGRVTLRSIVENYITLRYLAVNNDPDLWSAYRAYGSGQSKLALLKFDEIGEIPLYINYDRLKMNMNFDRAEEFIAINLGNWEKTSLREMSEKSGTKREYDLYYTITSGFVHGMWGAVDESIFEYCNNPLHRFHRIPLNEGRQLNDIIPDATSLINKILDDVDGLYPKFPYRLGK